MYALAGEQIGELRFENMRGEPGAGHFRLVFRIHFVIYARRSDEEFALLPFEADVVVSRSDEQALRLGRAVDVNQHSVININKHSSPQYIDFGLELDRARVEAIETVRGGGELRFRLTVSTIGSGPKGTWRALEMIQAPVNQGTWIEALQRMGYGETALLEVPVVPRDACPQLTAAFDYLADAQSDLLHGDWRDAVGKTRDIMEAIASALGEEGDQLAEFQKLFEKVRGSDRATRLRVLRRALTLFAAPAKHGDEKSSAIDWKRSDAVMAVHMAAALLSRASRGYLETRTSESSSE